MSLIRDRVVCIPGLKNVDWHFVPVSNFLPADEEVRRRSPMHPDWVRGLRDQVHAGGAKLFVKQIGSNHELWPSVTGKGEDPAQWPADLRVQEFPQ